MGKTASHIDRIVRQIVVCLFIVIGIIGVVYSIKAAKAQSIYVKSKYGVSCPLAIKPPMSGGQELWDLHDTAVSLYPHNYYFHSFAARATINLALEAASNPELSFDDYELLARKALFYAKMAIQTNPYDEESRIMYQEALVLNGEINAAVTFWESVVDLEYWNKAHHDIMAELYLKANSISLAVNELPHITKPELRKKLERYQKLLEKRRKNLNK